MGNLAPAIYDGITDANGVPLPGRWSSTNIVSAAQGGYYSAAMRYDAAPQYLEQLLRFLGHRVDVFDRYQRLAWQGMATEVEIHEPGYTYAYALDDLVNSCKVVFSGIEGEDADAGYRSETDWATDAASLAQYGQKDRVLSISGATDAQADLLRDRYLTLYARPLARKVISGEVGRPYAWLRCRGYWWTCDWRVFNEADVGDVATNTQIERIVDGVCAFIAGRTVAATGNSVSQHRDANQTAWQEILRLMGFGDSSNNPLLCQVWDGRVLEVGTLPAAPAYYRRRDGRYMDTTEHNVLDPWMLRAGQIVRLPGILPGRAVESAALDDPRNVLLQQVAYQDDTNLATLTPLRAQDLASLILGTLQPWE